MKMNAVSYAKKKPLSSRALPSLSLSPSPMPPASRVDSVCDVDTEPEQTSVLHGTKKAIDQLKSVTGNK